MTIKEQQKPRKNYSKPDYLIGIIRELRNFDSHDNRDGEKVKFCTRSELANRCNTARTNATFATALGILIQYKLIDVKSKLEFTSYFPAKSPIPNELRSKNANEILIPTEKAENIYQLIQNMPEPLQDFFRMLFQNYD